MKTAENNHGGNWFDRLLNSWPFCLHVDAIGTLFAKAWDEQGAYRPGDGSLFYNGHFFIRITSPFGIWLHWKPYRNLRIQAGAGWKLNGRFAVLLRAQTDTEAANGTHGPNYGQAIGWERGTA